MLRLNNIVIVSALVALSGCSSSDIFDDVVVVNPIDYDVIESTPQSVVDRHNQIRGEVYTDSAVIWSDTVASTAQDYANYLALTGTFEHDNSEYGENIYMSSLNTNYVNAIDSWYEEKVDYNYNDNSCSGVCGHYTQIIWKNTTEIGCGKAIYETGDFKGGTVIVCRYNPAGNYSGERPY